MKYITIILCLLSANLLAQFDDTTYLMPTTAVHSATAAVVNADSMHECDGMAGYIVLQYPADVPPPHYASAVIVLDGADYDDWVDSANCVARYLYYMRAKHFNDTVQPQYAISALAQVSQNVGYVTSFGARVTSLDWGDYFANTDTNTFANDHRNYFFATDLLNGNAGVRIYIYLSADVLPLRPYNNGYDTIWIDCVQAKYALYDSTWCHQIGGARQPSIVNDSNNDSIFSIHGIRK